LRFPVRLNHLPMIQSVSLPTVLAVPVGLAELVGTVQVGEELVVTAIEARGNICRI